MVTISTLPSGDLVLAISLSRKQTGAPLAGQQKTAAQSPAAPADAAIKYVLPMVLPFGGEESLIRAWWNN
jgi:hypothetical protein